VETTIYGLLVKILTPPYNSLTPTSLQSVKVWQFDDVFSGWSYDVSHWLPFCNFSFSKWWPFSVL